MPAWEDTLFERFIAPLFGTWLIDREALLAEKQAIDWEAASEGYRNPQVSYPAYYQGQRFHGIEQGYLSADAAITYDPVTQYALPPHEIWVRTELLQRVQGQPRRIVDLGCGTGTLTLMLKQQFPSAEVIGIDLSPYMLVKAAQKSQAAGLEILWRHDLAEATRLPDASVDVVTIALLFHETPPAIAQRILQEAYRLLTPGGQVLMLDGSQSSLRGLPWLMDIFEEPYIQAYAQGSADAWFGTAQFAEVRTEVVWGIHQVTRGVKPLAAGDRTVPVTAATVPPSPESELIPQWG